MTLPFLVQVGAVSFGFLTEIEEGSLAMTMVQGCTCTGRRAGGRIPPPLPDIVVSNTPTVSPLRSATSPCPYFRFPEPHKSSKILLEGHHPSPDASEGLPTPPATPSSVGGTRDNRIRLHQHRGYLHQMECLRYCCGRHPSSEGYSPRQCLLRLRRAEEGTPQCVQCLEFTRAREERRRWKRVGNDLRKLADHFQDVHSEINGKVEKNWLSVTLLVPVALTRCLSASILCLIRWRLFDGLQ